MASIRKRSGGWQARVSRKGFAPEVRTFHNKADAERWARTLESEMDRGCFVSRTETERLTLADVIDRYMREVSPTKRGASEEIIRLKAMKRHRMTLLSMATLTPNSIAEYRDDRLRTCGAGTVIRDLAMLSSVINHSRREWGLHINNPVAMIRRPPAPQGRNRILSGGEEDRLLCALTPTGRRNPFIKPLVQVALETAMRRSELLNLTWKYVNLDRRVAYLPITKSGTHRTVPLSSRAIEVLAAMPRSIDGRVFPVNIAAMEAAFLRGVRRAGLHGLHFHDLRHTATTRIAKKIPNVIELSAITGHANLAMLKRYYHITAEELASKLG
ncbi:MAG: site-specific integrase [Proteobacteria bacterium]|nr:site-specific integrase [Pseudomonadota bacterium]HQR04014.1 site-specific integrase [Rhodocyclaceae bacterium]